MSVSLEFWVGGASRRERVWMLLFDIAVRIRLSHPRERFWTNSHI